MTSFNVYPNSLSGALPALGWHAANRLTRVDASFNYLEGYLPEEGLVVLTSLRSLILSTNRLEGDLPDRCLEGFVALRMLDIGSWPSDYTDGDAANWFWGVLPVEGERNKVAAIRYELLRTRYPIFAALGSCELMELRSPFRIRSQIVHIDVKRIFDTRGGGLKTMSKLTELDVAQNHLSGSLPEEGLIRLSGLFSLILDENHFEGSLPGEGWEGNSMQYLYMRSNKFAGNVPEEVQGLTRMREFMITRNRFAGTMQSLRGMPDVERFQCSFNKLEGELPEEGLKGMMSVTYFMLEYNCFAGQIPGEGFQRMQKVKFVMLDRNLLQGSLPEEGLKCKAEMKELTVMKNCMTGSMPAVGLAGLRRFSVFVVVDDNYFRGTLPEEGLHGMTGLKRFSGCNNFFEGSLPEAGLRGKSTAGAFVLSGNRFTGTLPVEGLGGLTELETVAISANNFEGMLPEDLIGPWILDWDAESNRLSGTLPQRHAFRDLVVSGNQFQGALCVLPARVLRFNSFETLLASSNLLAGTVPERLMLKSLITLSGMRHQGIVPNTIGRTHGKMSLVLGHGLTGVWPRTVATFDHLSLWGNSLQGVLPEVKMHSGTDLLLQSNYLSCQLPRNRDVQLRFSIALVGNRFAQMQHFPPWITCELPGEMFCVSNYQGGELFCAIACGSSLLTLAAGCLPGRRSRWAKLKTRAADWSPVYASARGAWRRAIQLQSLWTCAACVLIPLYCSVAFFTCTIVLQRLRFQSVATGFQTQGWLELVAAVWILVTTMHFYSTHVHHATKPAKCATSKEGKGQNAWSRGIVWNLWLLMCVLASVPAAAYAAMKAVPNFMGMQVTFQLLLKATVALLTAVLTGFVLPAMAGRLCSAFKTDVSAFDLQVVGRLIATPIVPSLVTFLCHSDCLGAWAFFWQPCTDFSSRVITIKRSSHDVASKVLSRSEACGLNVSLKGSRCIDAVLERLSQILLTKFVHQTFTVPAAHLTMNKGIKLRESCVLLAYVLLVALMLAPSLPLILPLQLLLAVVHTGIFFGEWHLLHADSSSHLTQIGLGFASCVCATLQTFITFS